MGEHQEVAKALVVILQNRVSLDPHNLILSKIGSHIVDNQSIHALILIIGAHSNQQQLKVRNLLRLQGLDQVDPAKWEELTATLAQRCRDRRHTHTDTDNSIILVDHYRNKIEVEKREEHIAVVAFLAIGQRLKIVEFLIRLIENIEVCVAKSLLQLADTPDLRN